MGVAGRLLTKALRPRGRPVKTEPLTEGTPLIEGGGRRAAAPVDQTGDEIPLMVGQRGATNIRRVAEETGRQRGGFDANVRDAKIVAALSALGITATAANEIAKLITSDEGFGRAFLTARRAGKRTFTWRGNEYNTKTVEEVAELSRGAKSAPRPRKRPANMKRGGMTKSKKRTGHTDFRKGGMVYSTKLKRG